MDELNVKSENVQKFQDFMDSIGITDLQRMELTWIIVDLMEEATNRKLKMLGINQ